MSHRKDGGIVAPINITGLFGNNDDSDVEDDTKANYENNSEIQHIVINNINMKIRQYAFHQTNANQIWPGTFILAEFINIHKDRYSDGLLLELGSATGALAIYLRLIGTYMVITSDIDDEGEVAENILFNTKQNGLEAFLHIPYTWGSNWIESKDTAETSYYKDKDIIANKNQIKYIIASDILLYVSSYPALVQSLVEMFEAHKETMVEFLMAWNRRISASGEFFDLMKQAGFYCYHHGKCIYSFYTKTSMKKDEYLKTLNR